MEPQPKDLKRRNPTAANNGMALVMVLVVLVLLSGLLVAFFSSANLNRTAASSYADGAVTKHLSDSAVSYAMGQMRAATTGTNIAWASQPGMIRTYDNSGNKQALYKLYSSDKMVVTDIPSYHLSDDLKANAGASVTDWVNQPAIFTDLNSPAPDASGTANIYPIVDPTAVADGFSLANDPANNPAGAGTNQAPMPVKWIYVLKSGSLTAPTSVDATGNIASWSGAAVAPSASNPIVGRIAFWTDDESCKLNLNTASEPTPWASPMAVTFQDLNFGKYQPAQKEYQRFPGHPFTTALSPVLFPGTTGNLTASQMQSIYELVPRGQWGGSQAASIPVTAPEFLPVTPDQDRLFASVDEAIFAFPSSSGSSRPANAQFQSTLEKARFFLTANSRAPEVNLFGKPRVSIWPVPADAAKRTAYDRLTLFCSTIGEDKFPFSFQRRNPFSPTEDYANISRNEELYGYLQDLTAQPVPGYGGSFSAKWGADRDQILTEVFDYIRSTNLRDPLLVQRDSSGKALGNDSQPNVYAPFGQVAPIKIGSTQGLGRFHTISQFGLHFISAATANSANGTVAGRNDAAVTALNLKPGESAVEVGFFLEPFSPGVGFYQLQEAIYYKITFKNAMTLDGGSPLFSTTTQTLSSFPPNDVNFDSGFTRGVTHSDGRSWGGPAGIRGPIKEFGWAKIPVSKLVAVGGVGKTTMAFSGGTVVVEVYSGQSATFARPAAPASSNLIQTFTIKFPPADLPIPMLVTTPTTPWRDGNTDLEQWWSLTKWTKPANPVAGTAATPYNGRYILAQYDPQAPGAEYSDPIRRWGSFGATKQPGFKMGSIFRAEDVVRTVVPEHGDLRLVAASADPSALFTDGHNYNDTKVRFDHLLSEPEGPHLLFGFSNEPGPDPANPLPGDAPGVVPIRGTGLTDQLVPSNRVSYHYSRLPQIRPGAGKLYNHWNDFDNGFGYVSDGAYINKPDEGNISSASTTFPYFGWDFDIDTAKENLFSPSRLVPSAGMFGSLPTGVKRNRPWETLLFRPHAPSSELTQSGIHPGAQSPRDHLIMDLFWMPVIEPYAISEPFSTAGKVNLNYQIAPFNYIRRATALYGAFKSEQPLVLPNSGSKIYKLWREHTNDDLYPNDSKSQDAQVSSDWGKLFDGQAPFDKLRRPIDMVETLKQADDRFNGTGAYDARFNGNPDIFRSATEICELHLVRENESLNDYLSGVIWDSALPTGDNARERPYTNLYAKLTTRSNVYTVHMRVQALRKSKSTDPAQWDESKDKILGEYRGSAMIERFIDPADPRLVDYATTSGSLDAIYKFRVLSTKKFP